MQYTIANDKLTAVVDDHGFELVSLKRRSDGEELIWQGDERVWKRHSPVLFPLVGELRGNTYRYAGKTYTMRKHGFARDAHFSLLHQSADALVGELTNSEETREQYPFAFSLQCGFKLEGETLTVA